ANVGFQPGTGFNINSGLHCKLVEKNELGNTVNTFVTITDESVRDLYGGDSKVVMSISNVNPSSELPVNHYYALEATFTNSNGEIVTSTSDEVVITGLTTNINEVSSFPYEIYPNPSSDFISIKGKDGQDKPYTVSIYNTTGNLVKHINQTNLVNISDLAPGLYFINVNGNTSRFIKKQL
ncbi:MAG: T9SS type A sorting domain-containing protein, partial [Bacteroidales bacterium]|nr:T9SS type A sorting domain-containing protein [Bacteroidales bacterium]